LKKVLGLQACLKWWWWEPVSIFTVVLLVAVGDGSGDAEALGVAVADGDAEALGVAVAEGDAVAARTATRDPAAVNAISPFVREGVATAPMRGLGVSMEISFLSEHGPEAATTRWPKYDGHPPA
jgi:hypothetical protein